MSLSGRRRDVRPGRRIRVSVTRLAINVSRPARTPGIRETPFAPSAQKGAAAWARPHLALGPTQRIPRKTSLGSASRDASASAGRRHACAFGHDTRRKWGTFSEQEDTIDRWFLSLCNREATGGVSKEAVGGHLLPGSSQLAKDGSETPGMGGPRSIETRNKIDAGMAHRWNKTKKKTVLRIRLGRDQRRIRCLVALSKRSKPA
jgi:hypothetical protein